MPNLQRWQVVASLGEFGDFDSFDGGGLEAQQTDYTPAGQRYPIKLQGTHVITDVTLSRVMVPERDLALMDWINKYQNGFETSRVLTLKYLNQQGKVYKTQNYPRCVPKSVTPPSGKSGDNALAEIRVVLGVEAVS